ncbi:thiamine phosphate synthase [candidate division KSB1 bacterium]|nr:thiamine phosphate synthase [candidate division KSB1 bacterium]
MNIKSVDWSLYAILDEEWRNGRDIQSLAEDAIRGGITVLQYRNKVDESGLFFEKAKALSAITKTLDIPLIINDRTDISLAVDADGVHVGQQDLPVFKARELLGPGKIIGLSITNPDQMSTIDFTDYLGVGSVYPTDSKANVHLGGIGLLKTIRKLTTLPIIGIGGINADNLAPVFQAGCEGVSLISAIFGSDNVKGAARELRKAIDMARESN